MLKDAQIVDAFLFWGASSPGLPNNPIVDKTVSLTLPDGFKTSVVADGCLTRQLPNPVAVANGAGVHAYCRSKVSDLVKQHAGSNTFNGTYSVGELDAKIAKISTQNCNFKLNSEAFPNQPETVCCDSSDPFCQARHASWSLVIIYDTQFSETTERDILLYDGFVMLDEQLNSTGQASLNIDGFLVGDPPQASLSYYAMEGDKHLGNPYQDPPGGPDSFPCPTCWDFIAFNGNKLSVVVVA